LKRPAISNGSLINQAGRLAEPVSNRLLPVLANGHKRTIGVPKNRAPPDETLYLTDVEIFGFRSDQLNYELITTFLSTS